MRTNKAGRRLPDRSRFPDYFETELLTAVKDSPWERHFPNFSTARSYQITGQWYASAVKADPNAPQHLRNAAERIVWGAPRVTASGWTVTLRERPRKLADDVRKVIEGGQS